MIVYLHDSHITNKTISQRFIMDTRISKLSMTKVLRQAWCPLWVKVS